MLTSYMMKMVMCQLDNNGIRLFRRGQDRESNSADITGAQIPVLVKCRQEPRARRLDPESTIQKTRMRAGVALTTQD